MINKYINYSYIEARYVIYVNALQQCKGAFWCVVNQSGDSESMEIRMCLIDN